MCKREYTLYQGDTPKNKISYADCQFGKKHYGKKKLRKFSIMQTKTNKNASLIYY